MKYARNTPTSWLISCPPCDGNFKSNLKRASMSELKLALEEIPQEGNKTKRKAIEMEIKRRSKCQGYLSKRIFADKKSAEAKLKELQEKGQ